MSIFDFLKNKHNGSQPRPGHTGHDHHLSLPLNGPQYLRQYLTIPGEEFAQLIRKHAGKGQWFGQLIAPAGEKRFEIHYDGWLDEGTRIASATDRALKLVAIPADKTGEILLFDESLHGWNGYVANLYPEVRLEHTRPVHPYPSADDPGIYRILLHVSYSENAIGELRSELNNGQVELEDGSVVSLTDAFDNGFDRLSVYAINDKNEVIEIISEELT